MDEQDAGHAPGEDHQWGHGIGGGTECVLCPICVLLQALTDARPEVTQHLLAAARELALALKAGLEAHAEAADHASARADSFRRIKID